MRWRSATLLHTHQLKTLALRELRRSAIWEFIIVQMAFVTLYSLIDLCVNAAMLKTRYSNEVLPPSPYIILSEQASKLHKLVGASAKLCVDICTARQDVDISGAWHIHRSPHAAAHLCQDPQSNFSYHT